MKTLLQIGCIYDGTGTDAFAGDIQGLFHLGRTRDAHQMIGSSDFDSVDSFKQARARYLYE